MCFSELLEELRRNNVSATEGQIRWAIKTGRVSKPRMNGSLRFVFEDENVAELIQYFSGREAPTCA